MTILILFRRLQWWIAVALLLWAYTTGCPVLSWGSFSSKITCWVFSWEKLDWDSCVFAKRSQRVASFLSSMRFFSFPLLRRPSFVIISTWVACWERAFVKLLVITVRRGFWVAAHNGLPRSIHSLSFRTPGILISSASLPRAFWRRGWQIRGSPCNKAPKKDHNPILNNLLVRVYQVALIDHLQQKISKDLDFRSISSPGLDEVEDDTTDGILAVRFIIGRDFAVTRSSPESCWDRFAIVSEYTVELKWLILNKHNRWFRSSRVKIPLVRKSTSWCLVSMYLIWIFGSILIRSNNQSSATLWVLETCLIVGLLPLISILITASLSSNTYNKAS